MKKLLKGILCKEGHSYDTVCRDDIINMSYPRPFGIVRPDEQHNRIYVILNGPKGEVCFDLNQASIDYFPGPGNPSHIIFWHQNGVIIADYAILECTGPYRGQKV